MGSLRKVKMEKPNRGLIEQEANAEFYYHGTSKMYLDDQLRKHGRYQHDRLDSGIFISTCLSTAKGYAKDRTICFDAGPIVLKVSGDKIRERVHEHPRISDICVDFLLPEEFKVIRISSRDYHAFKRKH